VEGVVTGIPLCIEATHTSSQMIMKKPPPPAHLMRPGDWLCEKCGEHNFANKLACFSCRAAAPAASNRVVRASIELSPELRPALRTVTNEPSRALQWYAAQCHVRIETQRLPCNVQTGNAHARRRASWRLDVYKLRWVPRTSLLHG
jgi:hypothetical protein